MRTMSRLLLIRTSSMGDLVHTLPAVTDLSRRFPALAIDWLAEESFVDIAALHPAVDNVIPLAWRRWRRQLWSPATWRELGALRHTLRQTHYDLVLDSQGLLKSVLFARWVPDTPLAGYDRSSIREPLASLFYDKTYSVSRSLSAVTRNRLLFGQAFGYQPDLDQCDFGVPAPAPGDLPTGQAVLLTATSRDSKLWPETHWMALADRLHAERGWPVMLPWGNPAERARAERIAAGRPFARVAPRLTLKQAAALLGNAVAVIGVDTGLTHLANALPVPLVAIYTDTDPQLTGVIPTPRARNLGGIGQCPDVDAVWQALQECMA